MMTTTIKVYVSGPLTQLPRHDRRKLFYESIGKLCFELGLSPYLPHLKSDPEGHPELSARDVYQIDKEQVLGSDVIIAYVGDSSLGVGMEIGWADCSKIPTVLLYQENRLISRLIRGTPVVIAEVQFLTELDALTKLQKVLVDFLELERSALLTEEQLRMLLDAQYPPSV